MYKRLVAGHMMYQRKHVASYQRVDMIMMSFICSCRNKIGAELHIYLENLPPGIYESSSREPSKQPLMVLNWVPINNTLSLYVP